MFCKNCGSQVPEGIAFCAACGTPVAGAAPAAAPVAAAPAAPKSDKSGLIKLVAIIAVVAVVLGLFISLLGGGSPKSVAKKYVEASIEGDIKAAFSVTAGKMQKYLEKEALEDDDEQEMLFEMLEKAGDELDVKVKVNNFGQAYKALKKLTKASNNETYGKGYKVTVEVREVKDMRNSELEAIQDAMDNDEYEDYINPDKIKKGKKVTVKVIIDGKEDTETYDEEIMVVKYKGKWKVVSNPANMMF